MRRQLAKAVGSAFGLVKRLLDQSGVWRRSARFVNDQPQRDRLGPNYLPVPIQRSEFPTAANRVRSVSKIDV